MTGYEMIKKHREDALEQSVKELERLAEAHKDAVHYLSQEAYKMGIKFAIREIEGTEMLMLKAHKELPYSNPKEAEREHGNTMRLLATIKNGLMARLAGKAFLYSKKDAGK